MKERKLFLFIFEDSKFYTSSHSHMMRQYSHRIPSGPFNAVVAVQRRYQNILHDARFVCGDVGVFRGAIFFVRGALSLFIHSYSLPSLFPSPSRQARYEMLLGVNIHKYFPSMTNPESAGSLLHLSNYPATCIKPVPSVPGSVPPDLLLHDVSAADVAPGMSFMEPSGEHCVTWLCPEGFQRTEVQVWMRLPCVITHFALHVDYGSSSGYPFLFLLLFPLFLLDKILNLKTKPNKTKTEAFPESVDVYVGQYLDSMTLALQNLKLPKAEKGTVCADILFVIFFLK